MHHGLLSPCDPMSTVSSRPRPPINGDFYDWF